MEIKPVEKIGNYKIYYNNEHCIGFVPLDPKALEMTAKEMFEELGYTYEFVDNKDINCEDIILYTHSKQDLTFQFNLLSELVCMQMKNKFKDYDKVGLFLTKELITAINKQIEELGW